MFTSVSHRSGRLQPCAGGGNCFEPTALPPQLSLSPSQWRCVTQAECSLGRLQGQLERTDWPRGLTRLAAVQEAVASSQLEGRDLTLQEALWWQLDGEPDPLRKKAGALRLTLAHADLLLSAKGTDDPRRIHEALYQHVQGRERVAGRLRSSLIWLGPRGSTARDAPYVPPSPADLQEHVDKLRSFLAKAPSWPRLVHAALAYYQLETIHPFLDGSGRVARTLLLQRLQDGSAPDAMLLLRPSRLWARSRGHFRQLQAVREHGTYEEWIEAFARSIQQCADDAILMLQGVNTWLLEAREILKQRLPNQRLVAERLLRGLVSQPLLDVTAAAALCERDYANANILIQRLRGIGLLREITGRRRNRRYVAPELTRLVTAEPA